MSGGSIGSVPGVGTGTSDSAAGKACIVIRGAEMSASSVTSFDCFRRREPLLTLFFMCPRKCDHRSCRRCGAYEEAIPEASDFSQDRAEIKVVVPGWQHSRQQLPALPCFLRLTWNVAS
jgi:hypothetical protein